MSYYDTKTVLRVASRVPHLRLAVLAAFVGAAAGGAAWLLLHLIGLFTNLFLFHQWGWDVPSFTELQPSPWIVVAAVGGAGVVTLLARWAPVIRGHGIPEAMEAVLVRQSRIAPRTAVAKPLSAAIAIGTGGPFGAEGPIIVTGGALGSLLGQVAPRVGRTSARSCSPAAPPPAWRRRSARRWPPSCWPSSCCCSSSRRGRSSRSWWRRASPAAVHAALFGTGPLFAVPTHDFAGLAQLPWFALLGDRLRPAGDADRQGPVRRRARLPPAARRRGAGTRSSARSSGRRSACWCHARSASATTSSTTRSPGAWRSATLAALAVGKLVVWWLALASGTSGGTLAPILLISSCSGGARRRRCCTTSCPAVSPTAFALVAMAATFGAATRAPFAAIVFVFELTRDYDAILPLMRRHRARRHDRQVDCCGRA